MAVMPACTVILLLLCLILFLQFDSGLMHCKQSIPIAADQVRTLTLAHMRIMLRSMWPGSISMPSVGCCVCVDPAKLETGTVTAQVEIMSEPAHSKLGVCNNKLNP